jgi:hypothetical protein
VHASAPYTTFDMTERGARRTVSGATRANARVAADGAQSAARTKH